jgi:hypothetical protein
LGCDSILDDSISDAHLVEVWTCLDNKELKAYSARAVEGGPYEGLYVCGQEGSPYRLFLMCQGKYWEGKEGMTRCSQLFNQITDTFQFF